MQPRPTCPARRAAAALALAAAVACRGGAPAVEAPEVKVHVTVGEAAARVMTEAAARRGLARVRLVAAAAQADVLWAADPTEVVDAGEAVAAGAAPAAADVDARWRDPRGRFAPVCARARVLLLAPRAALPLEPTHLRDLADARLAGQVALAPPGEGANATAMAALSITFGEASLRRFLDLVARNRPLVAAGDDAVRAAVARGDAALGLAGSEQGAAGALSAAGLQVVLPDQGGRGAVLLPTAVALARGAAGAPGPEALARFLAGAEAERLLVARVPGLMPLRPDVPVPAGVRPAGHAVALALDWDRLAAERRRLAPVLRAWAAR